MADEKKEIANFLKLWKSQMQHTNKVKTEIVEFLKNQHQEQGVLLNPVQ